MNIEKAFGEVLKQMRNKKKMSQEQLALEANLERTYISMMERGTRKPTINTIFKLSRVLGIKPSQLIECVEEIVFENPSC
ncbi:helix-turn-helix domain-containing protein [Priestia sp. YIM B13448]|uniref:helix-turn-helix domain-containing protein n=1 Tax=Priestia sp. YIM B13448 TaxID=3366308 RepID=UPI00366BBB6C